LLGRGQVDWIELVTAAKCIYFQALLCCCF